MRIISLLVLILPCVAVATPTAEGLFRNVNNKELSGNLIVVTAMVDQMKLPPKENPLMLELSPTSPESSKIKNVPVYYKWLFSLERENTIDMIQVAYSDGAMKEDQIIGMRYLPDLQKVIASDNSLERSLFYGLMSMLSLNESKIIGEVIKKYGQGFVANKELMTREKVNLYRAYKEYLEKRQDDETLISPLEPQEEERAERVKEILDSPMYRDAGNVKLARIDGELVWRVDFKSMAALFTNETHRLKRFEYLSPLGDLRIIADDYVLFNGAHELPKTLIFKDMSMQTWRIRLTGLSHINNRSTAFTKRAQDYSQAAKKAKSQAQESESPELVPYVPQFIY